MALTPFEAHPKDQRWKSDKKLSDQIDLKIKKGEIILEIPESKVTTRQLTKEERRKYFS